MKTEQPQPYYRRGGLISPYAFVGLPENLPPITFEIIRDVVCYELGTTPDDILEKSRKGDLVRSRYVIWHFVMKYSPTSLKRAGLYFSKDHATVIHGIRTVRREIDMYPRVAQLMNRIDAMILQRAGMVEANRIMNESKN